MGRGRRPKEKAPVPGGGTGALLATSSWPSWRGPPGRGLACRRPLGRSLARRGLARRSLLGGGASRCLLGGSRSGGLAGRGDRGVARRVRALLQLRRCGGGQDGVLERLHGRDARLLRCLDPDRLARCRVPAHAGAARLTLTNLAKPGMETGSPFETTAVTTSVNPSMTVITVFSSTSDWTATALASSLLFMAPIVADARPSDAHLSGHKCRFLCPELARTRSKAPFQRPSPVATGSVGQVRVPLCRSPR